MVAERLIEGKKVTFGRPLARTRAIQPWRGPPGGSSTVASFRNSTMPLRLGKRMRYRTRSYTRQKRRRKSMKSGQGVTDHYDARLIYRKRSMRPRMKRRWKKFKNRVLAVAEKEMGSQTVVMNSSQTVTNTTAGNQVVFDCGLYTSTSTASYLNDLDNIAALNAGALTTPTTGLAVSASTKIIFKSAVLDMTIRNASTYQDAGAQAPSSAARMEVDIYEITLKSVDEEGVTYTSLLNLFNQNAIRTQTIGGGGTALQLTSRGVTPWDLTYVLSNFGIKIWKKTKFQISNNDQITYQMRDPRRHVMNQRELSSAEGFAYRNLTKLVLIVGRLAPGLTVGNINGTYQERLVIGLSRKYFYKVENWSEDRTSYMNT